MELFFRKYGSGQPIIILHGLFGISDNWVTHAKRLGEKYEVFIPDQRNHGQSPHHPEFSYFTLVSDLLEFMNQRQLEKAVLIGHSMGGKVAMNFALEYPHMVQKLVVIDISPRAYQLKNTHQSILTAINSIDLNHVHARTEIEQILKNFLANERVRLFVLKNLYRKEKGLLDWRINISSITNNIDEIAAGLVYEGAYPGPTLFIKGADSDYITPQDEALILEYFPNSFIETIEGAGHWVHADAPGTLCKLLSSFLGRACDFKP